MRDILKRIFIGVAIGMALFFLKTEVFADTVTISQSNFQLATMFCMNRNGSTSCSDFQTTGYTSAGTWSTFTSDLGVTGSGTYIVISYNRSYATLNTGKVYTYTFRQQFNPKDTALLYINSWQYQVYANVGSTLSDSYVINDSCSSRNVATHDYAIETTCTFEVNQNASYVLVRTAFGSGTVPRVNYTMSNAHLESSMSEIGAINNQTSVLKQQFQRLMATVISGNQEMFDLDSPSVKQFTEDFDIEFFTDEEDDITDYMDVDVSVLDYDNTEYRFSFQWIWNTINTFININAKVFTLITTFLTMSFVGLVLGRG